MMVVTVCSGQALQKVHLPQKANLPIPIVLMLAMMMMVKIGRGL
jgi:hypothetical protein